MFYLTDICCLFILFHISYCFYCKDVVYETKHELETMMIDTQYPSRVKKFFDWKTICKNPIQSPFLSVRPGLKSSDNKHNYEVISVPRSGLIYSYNIFHDPVDEYNIIFFVYASSNTNFILKMKTSSEIGITVNHHSSQLVEGKIHRYCKNHGLFHCKTVKWNYLPYDNRVTFAVEMNWNQIFINKVLFRNKYTISLLPNHYAKHTAFIPWYNIIPTECKVSQEWLNHHKYYVDYVIVAMNFTYGQSFGIRRLDQCLNTLVDHDIYPDFQFRLKWIEKYSKAQIRFQGSEKARFIFLNDLNDRKVSGKCIEYTCIRYITRSENNVPSELQHKIDKSNSLFQIVSKGYNTEFMDGINHDISLFLKGKTNKPQSRTSFIKHSNEKKVFITLTLHNPIYTHDKYDKLKSCLSNQLGLDMSNTVVTGRIGTKYAIVMPEEGDFLETGTFPESSQCYEDIDRCYIKYESHYSYRSIILWVSLSIVSLLIIIVVFYSFRTKYLQSDDDDDNYGLTDMNLTSINNGKSNSRIL